MLGHPEPTWGEVRRVSELLHPLSSQQCTLAFVALTELPRGRPSVPLHTQCTLFIAVLTEFPRGRPAILVMRGGVGSSWSMLGPVVSIIHTCFAGNV